MKPEQEDPTDIEWMWNLTDEEFFHLGACHILAYAYLKKHSGEDLTMVQARPKRGRPGHHVYIRKGEQSFDYRGWMPEQAMLTAYYEMYGLKAGSVDIIPIYQNLELLCAWNGYRPPSHFLELPWRRAISYINKLEQPRQEQQVEYLNPAERQAIWELKIREHGETCSVCEEDKTECAEWQHLIGFYNTAAWPAVDLWPGES